jgi:hypothetical protein
MNRTIAQLFNPTWPAKSLLALVALIFPLLPVTAQMPGYATLPGHVVGSLAYAKQLPHDPLKDEEQMSITVVLNLTDPQGAEALKEEYTTPTSPHFHKSITPAEFAQRFGPSQEAWDAVLSHLTQNGLVLSDSTSNRWLMTLTGTRAQVQSAFGVVIADYQLGERTFHAIASDPVVPSEVAPLILHVGGLTNLARPHNAVLVLDTPAVLKTAYNSEPPTIPANLDGSGQTVALVSYDLFQFSDVANWLNHWGLPATTIDNLSVLAFNGGAQGSGCTASDAVCGASEELLDIAAIWSVAPGAKIRVFSSRIQNTDYTTLITYPISYLASQSSSTGAILAVTTVTCENDLSSSDVATIDTLAADARLNGVSVFAGSGDHGATCVDSSGTYPNSAPVPADSPNVVAVGGTRLDVISTSDLTYNHEAWWNDLNGAGGYSVSQFFAEPSYQAKLLPGLTGRSIPDLSMTAGPFSICQATSTVTPNCGDQNHQDTIVGGTSLSTPLVAAAWALAEQARGNAGLSPLSPEGDYFYNHRGALHDFSTFSGLGNDFQHVGLGSINIADMVSIASPPRIDSFSPATGPGAGGTKLTILGAGFVGVTKVTIGGVAGTNLVVESDTKLTVDTPEAAGLEQTAALKVVTAGGTATSSTLFDYDPEIFLVGPSEGPFEGGTSVTVYGVGLSKDLVFQFGSDTYSAIPVSCGNVIGGGPGCTVVTPAHAPGSVHVVAATPWGGTSATPSGSPNANLFTYEPPSISNITPVIGPTSGGSQITITGVSLGPGSGEDLTTVNFGTLRVPVPSCSSDHTFCFLTSPPHTAGSVPLSVTVHGKTLTYAQPFTFEVFPTITGISPPSANPGAVVNLKGTGFSTTTGRTTFDFFGISVPGNCTSTTQCAAVVPTETVGTAQTTAVTVTVNGNTSLDSVTFAYATLIKPPPCKGATCG